MWETEMDLPIEIPKDAPEEWPDERKARYAVLRLDRMETVKHEIVSACCATGFCFFRLPDGRVIQEFYGTNGLRIIRR